MDSKDYQKFYEQVGKKNGWDFSSINCLVEGDHFNLYQEVAKRCQSSDLLLDIGTGGGEAVLTIADAVLLLIGIDQAAGMIETAKHNLAQAGIPNARFLNMDARQLHFPDDFFDIISCRHSPFSAQEVARVLKQGGTFLTQQVAEGDKLNLKEAFGRGQAYGVQAETLQERYLAELQEAGFSNIQSFALEMTEYYKTAEDLIFLLKHAPIIPDFGSEQDFQILEQFIKDNQTAKGIRTTSSRFVLISRL